MLLVDLVGVQLDPQSGASILVLREHDAPNRLLPIVVGGAEAASIAIAASGQTLPRPLTHDLMATLVDSFDGHVEAAEVTDLQNGSFLANLTITGPTGERRLDTRPSDAIALAIRLHAPVFVSEHVLDEAGALPEIEDATLDQEAPDADQIDAEVDEFRVFLEDLDPADFTTPPPAVEQIDAPESDDEGEPED